MLTVSMDTQDTLWIRPWGASKDSAHCLISILKIKSLAFRNEPVEINVRIQHNLCQSYYCYFIGLIMQEKYVKFFRRPPFICCYIW